MSFSVYQILDDWGSFVIQSNTVLPPPIPVGGGGWGIAITPNGHFAYATNVIGNSVWVIDIATNTVIPPPIPVGDSPRRIAITPNGQQAYVTNARDNTVSVIDTATNAVVPPAITVGDWPLGIAITPNGRSAYVTNSSTNTVSVIDTATNTVVPPAIPVGGGPVGIAITPNGRWAYVTNAWDNTISVIDTATNTVVPPAIPVGERPWSIAITPNGRSAYVANIGDDTVSVIDTTTNTVLPPPIPVGDEPNSIAITPGLPPPPCSQDAEVYDEMQTELSHNIEIFGLGRVCTADLAGVIGVKRYLPYIDPTTGFRTIDTKITKLELTGVDPSCGEIKISLQSNQASLGKVVEKTLDTCFPADSYFDVYIKIEIPSLQLTFANCEPAKMRCTVSTMPPIGCVYQLGTGFDVPLYDAASLDCASPGNPVGQILAADHKPTAAQGPPVVIPPPTRIQLNLYNTTTNQWMPLTEQVRKDHFKPTLPCVVIVHGFNIDLSDSLPVWYNDLAKAISGRQGENYNILSWDWLEEAKGGTNETSEIVRLQYAASHVFDQSKKLTRSLQELFNPTGYQKPIHLFGHSLGSFLAAFCGIHLQNPGFGNGVYPVANITLWDPPDLVPNSLANNIPILRSITTYVDLFSGTYNSRAYFSNVWYVVPEGGHDTYRWYQEHAPEAAEPTLHQRLTCDDPHLPSTVGFGVSRTHAPVDRELRMTCQAQELDMSLVTRSNYRRCEATDELVYAQYCIANALTPNPIITVRLNNGIGNRNCECLRPTDLSLRMRLRRPDGGGGGEAEPLTATYTLPLTVAPEWDYLSFTYRMEAAPSPATFTLALQDGEETVPLFLATSGVELGEGDRQSPLLDVSAHHGKTVSAIFALASTKEDAIVEVSNLALVQGSFYNNLPPVADAGANQAVAVTDPLATAVQLDGSGSRDANGDPLVYVWTVAQDPANAEQEGIVAVGKQPTVELPLGGYEFTLFVRDPFDGVAEPQTILIEVEYPFRRGDANADGQADITDAIAILEWLFLKSTAPLCQDAADIDDNADVDLSDPIALLSFLFLGTVAIAPPYPDPGLDPTPDMLGCDLKLP